MFTKGFYPYHMDLYIKKDNHKHFVEQLLQRSKSAQLAKELHKILQHILLTHE